MSGEISAWTRLGVKLSNQRATLKEVGLRNWFRMKVIPVFTKLSGSTRMGRLTLPTGHSLFFRPISSDRYVFHQIFIEREYSCFDDLDRPDLIIDCGANVGYSSGYFLSRFPSCSVIAVEPDPENFKMLERNLAQFGNRARAIRAAVWSHSSRLKIKESTYRDGLEWAFQVSECKPDEESSVEAVDIGALLRESGHERISLLKMDIEGAEAVVFSSEYEPWIDLIDNIAIELHDDTVFGDARRVFATAISGRGFKTSSSGELTVCRRSSG